MKIRKVNPLSVAQAKDIMYKVCLIMDIPVESVISSSRAGALPYTRKLIIYAIRNQVTVQVDIIASFFGWHKTPRLVSSYYAEIKHWYKIDDKVKADVNKIYEALKPAA